MPSPSRVAPTLSRLFHANSRITIARPIPITANASRLAGASYMNFPGRPRVDAPDVAYDDRLDALLDSRSSTQAFAGRMDVDALLTVLKRSTRINRASENVAQESSHSQRVYPSAGALYPVEFYVVPLDVTGLSRSVYHWDVLEECLEELWPAPELDIEAILPGLQPASDRPAAIIVMSAFFARVEWKYGERGYRFCLIEAGAVGQTMQLVGGSAGVATRFLGGFVDSAWDELLRVNGDDEATLMLVGLG